MIWVASGNYGILLLVNHGSIAQLAEHGPFKPGVVGSSPTRPTTSEQANQSLFWKGDLYF